MCESPGNVRSELSPILPGTLCFGATPRPWNICASAVSATLLCRWREVTLPFHHRRIFLADTRPHLRRIGFRRTVNLLQIARAKAPALHLCFMAREQKVTEGLAP